MHVFGVVCYAYVQNAKKLEPRSREGIFVGYDKKSPAYLVYCPESRRVERVRCVKFFDSLNPENEVLSTDEEVETVPSVLPNVGQNSNVNETEKEALPDVQEGTTRYPTRARNKPSYLSEYVVESVLTLV